MTGSRAGCLSLWTIFLCSVTSRASLMRETAQQVVSQSVFYDAFSTRIFDPQGRVLQLEYAQEATKKGGAAVGAVCGDLGVIASWTPRVSQRQCKASEQPTRGIWSGDSHVALAGSGMVTDALVLVDLVRKECLSHRYIFDSPVRISRLMSSLQKEMYDTERTRIIPYAVDLLICGSDQCGTFLYNIGPSSVYESYQAYAVGHNADVAKSFLATRLDELGEETRLRDLVSVALKALVKTFPSSTQDLKPGVRPAAAGDEVTEDISLAVVGKNIPVTQLKVSWDSATRRLDVSLPPGLAEM